MQYGLTGDPTVIAARKPVNLYAKWTARKKTVHEINNTTGMQNSTKKVDELCSAAKSTT